MVLFLLANVLEELEGLLHVTRHVQVDGSFFVVPRQLDADVSAARPIGINFVMFLEGGHEVDDVFFTNVFHAKIVNHECEGNGSCGVLPEAGYQFALEVTVFVESSLEELVCKKSCLR